LDAIQSAFSNNVPGNLEKVKKVSFSTLPDKTKKKKNCNTTKSTTLKSSSSKEKTRSDQAEDLLFQDFNKFYEMFVNSYAEIGIMEGDNPDSKKVVHFMNNREDQNDRDYDKKTNGSIFFCVFKTIYNYYSFI
jgi:hypothetical protein